MITNTQEIEFNNSELKSMFDDFRKRFFELKDKHGVESGLSSSPMAGLPHETYCQEDYLIECQKKPSEYGFAKKYHSINIPQMARDESTEASKEWRQYLKEQKDHMSVILGAHTSALSLFYPPDGFIGWHTNANATSHQLLFTWSETGEGYFRYQDPKTKEIVTLQDKPGWNVRAHYFGGEHEPDFLYWHTAYTKCDRFSFAYKWVSKGVGTESHRIASLLFDEAIADVQSK